MPHAIHNLAHSVGVFEFNAAGQNSDSLYFSIFSRLMVGYITLVAAVLLVAGAAYKRLSRDQ